MNWAYNCGVNGIDYRKARDDAADAGTLAHAMIEAHIKGEDPEKVLEVGTFDGLGKPHCRDPQIAERARRGFVGYLGWTRQSGIEVTDTEMPLVSEEHRYGGTPDGVGKIHPMRVLVDWKTGRTYADHLIQLAAYRHLWDEHHPDDLIVEAHLCRFDKEYGTFTHKQVSAEMLDVGWDAFLRLREVYELDKELARMTK